MCIFQPSIPSAPPPPPPPPAPPPPPKITDPNVKQAKLSQRRIAALAAGRRGTILGGSITSDPENSTGKTLLGS